ncbi:MAG TPA: thioredoxin domain-containing protein, partial [Actinomycetota bacterium]|nr:thioredoxin domain-containing protein [Actinomycetota bacterium]
MANRLKDATSPYLLQHADNPVDWYEWGEEALRRARDEDRPILLSVGYAACHWCHVMERESFEDEETARLMNEHFVSVKVDREERPDVDAIYMDAVQAMTGHGGWPMTVFLGPDGRPFFAGTYFPPEDRHGIPSFRKVLTAVAQAWRNEREKLLEQGERVTAAISRRLAPSPEPLTEQTLRDAVTGLAASFDEEWGGFGAAPKFPQPMTIEFLLRRHRRGDDGALAMATRTLDRMSAGGMHDQIGGGFHRYSTDREWRVPHFEKMLYDNALLARAYLHAYQVTGAARYREVCATTLDYVLNDLRHADGGLFSSQDADSEGVEGKFYAWTWPELVDVAGEEAARRFGGSPEGNWGGESGTEPAVVLLDAWADIGDELAFHQDRAATEGYLETRSRLVEAHGGRPHPATDDKVIAAWNGLAIQALAEAGRALD